MTDFFDLPAEERGYWYQRAEDENGGQDFHDLPPEERGYWYDRAADEGRSDR